jgi:1,4-alpha-glucan branching enzyme
MGAQLERQGRRRGVNFAVWAPNAAAVSVIGDFNSWSPGETSLQPSGDSGVWQGFVAGLKAGALYKFAIRPGGSRVWLEKSDPYGAAAELRPNTASIVADLDSYVWADSDWMDRRAETDWSIQPVATYEVHLSSWRRDPGDPERFLTYRELADTLPAYVRDLGYTHLELLPVAEHPLDMSWGYQTVGYFAPTARYGSPDDFMHFVDCCHQAGLGIILDWVPAHFPKDAHGLGRFDGSALYEHQDPRQGEHPDWGTYIFNYGRSEVQTFLLSNALSWLDRYHIDGLRVDAVASMLYLDYSRQAGEWLPNRYGGRENLEAIDLLRHVNAAVHEEHPGVLMIAEESTAWPKVTGSVESGGLGFDLKWNMGWMHDTLTYMSSDPIYRRFHQSELTFSMMYAFTEHFVLPLSHDEVVHGKGSMLGKMPGDLWRKFANLRLLYGYMWCHPGKKLLFMGSEIGQWSEWNYAGSLDWHLLDLPGDEGRMHRGLQDFTRSLNTLYTEQKALHQVDFEWQGFEWIDFSDADASVLAFLRRDSSGGFVIAACNFTPVVRESYRIGLPRAGAYLEALNSDDVGYGGSGVLNSGDREAEEVPWHGQPYSTSLTLPPLGVSILVPG